MQASSQERMKPFLTPAKAWAFALGTSIGWGSLVVTGNTYLAQGGPLGSVLGLIAGALIMLAVSKNYAYLMECCPEPGGAYAYCREAFGYDQGFLCAWFLALTYLAILWANLTALPLFSRYFLGDVFEFGYLYTLFDYDVYLGEALLSVGALLLVTFLCANRTVGVARLMMGLAVFFSVGIPVCFLGAAISSGFSLSPAFSPDGSALHQVVRIAVISPWAFIGFESISHRVGEFSFKDKRYFRVLAAAVAAATLLYICATLLSASAYPPEYESWVEYIRDLDRLEGIKGLPAFYAVDHYLGAFGVAALMLSLLALILSSLIGNIAALSRLFYALGRDGILPQKVGRLNQYGLPGKADMLVAAVSALIPFVGRTAIGWIVDVTTLGSTLVYALVSAAALKTARFRSDKTEMKTGAFGVVAMVGFGLALLLPSLFSKGAIEPESFFLFVAWSVLGFVFFRVILKKDQRKRFGKSIIVWIALLSLILFVSLVWMNQSVMAAADKSLRSVERFYTENAFTESQAGVVGGQMEEVRVVSARSVMAVVGVFALALGVLINNYRVMSKRAHSSELELGLFRDIANKDALTGVKSKHAFTEKEKEMDEAIAGGGMEPFALGICDGNGLKYINDTLGHKAGDAHILKACQMICGLFQHSPVYRIGGDEFAVILTKRDYENRERILSELHDLSAAHIASGDVVVSGGMACFRPGEDGSVHDVFARADALMYQEKNLLKSMGAATR